MRFVVDGLIVASVVLAAVLALTRVLAERARALSVQRRQAALLKRVQRDEYDEARFVAGSSLVCIGCSPPYSFGGPLPDTGCPQCHMTSLVETQAEYDEQTAVLGTKG